jgi:hypothetical protein
MPIPDDVPDEMDWHHPNPPNWSIAAAVVVVIMIAAPLAYFFGHKIELGSLWNMFSHWGGLLVVWAYKSLRDRLIMARSVAIRRDHLEMRTPRGCVVLQWADIRYVHWDNARKSLALGRATYTDVGVIPYLATDPDSAACILDIIRHLRLAHHTPPVAIPTQLLPGLYSGSVAPVKAFSDGDAVEVKIAMGPVQLALALLCVAPALAIWWLARDPLRARWITTVWVFVAPLALVALAVASMFVARTVYRADSRGITVKLLLKRRFIDWRDVAAYVVTPGRKVSRELMDPSGRVLLRIPFSERAHPNAERFIAFLDARLSAVRQQDMPTLVR